MNPPISDDDMELGTGPELCATTLDRKPTWIRKQVQELSLSFNENLTKWAKRKPNDSPVKYQIEDFREGYPRFAALMAADDSFQVFRRFSRVRTRLLLLSQDRVSQLELELDKIDLEEASPLFLASNRRDKNAEREKTVTELREALKTYDEELQRSVHVSMIGEAHPRDIQSLQNWSMSNGCISREDTAFLGHRKDLLCLSTHNDNVVSWLERYVSEKLLHFTKSFRSDVSRDEHVHIYSRGHTSLLARIILGPLIVTLVLIPVVICSAVNDLTARLAIVIVATSFFITVLSSLTRGKALDLVVAGAT